MPRKKENKSQYKCVRYREDTKQWQVRSRSKKLHAYETFATKEEAESYYLRLKSSALPSSMRNIDKHLTLDNMIQRYIDQVSSVNCKEYTVRMYKAYHFNHIQPYFKNRLAYTVTKNDIEEFKKHLSKKNIIMTNQKSKAMSKRLLSNATINKVLTLLNASYEHAIDGYFLLENPCARVKKLSVRRKEAKFLDITEARKLLKTAKEDITVSRYGIMYGEYYLILLVAIITGARQGEVLALTWDDILFKKNSINIDKTYCKGILSPVPKTEASERNTNNLPNFLFEELVKYRKTQKNNPLNLVFPSHEGGYRDGHNLTNRVLPRLLEKTGVKKVTWHQLRHTNISALAEKNVSPAYIQRNAGHSNLATTLKIYTHVSDAMNKQAQEALEVFNISDE